MKLPPARLAAFLRSPDPGARAALVYGPDAGLVRERADHLASAICPDPRDPFRVADLAAGTLVADPARLHDEAAAQSLSGGRRLIRLREGVDAVASLFERFLAAPPRGDSFIVVEAGDLSTRSSLRRVFEAAEMAVVIPCYADSARDIGELIREVLNARGITASPEATGYLVAHLGSDRAVTRQELEKLALFAGDGGRIGLAEAMACVGDSAALTIEDIVLAVAEGDLPALERTLLRAFQEGEMPVTVLRALMRHFQRLHLVAARIAAGTSEEEALAGLRPPLFFKLRDRFVRQLGLWSARRAAVALEILTQAELNAKRTGPPPETICREAALRLARGAAGARSRRA